MQVNGDTSIRLRRMDGTPKQLSEFKKGYRVRTLEEAETYLWQIGMSVPVGERHKVAYSIELDGQPTLYGAVYVDKREPTAHYADIQAQLEADYGKECWALKE